MANDLTTIVETTYRAERLDFLGYGITRPFVRDRLGDWATARGKELVEAAVGQILGTVGASEFTEGELPWDSEFGSLLHNLRHRQNNEALVELARVYVVEPLKRWEPRIRVTSVEIGKGPTLPDGGNKLLIRVNYNFVNLQTGAVVLSDLETQIVI